jgi:hypothetical protein
MQLHDMGGSRADENVAPGAENMPPGAEGGTRIPGDLRPGSGRRLDRPPGERLAVSEPPLTRERPSTARAVAGGIAGAVLVTVAWVVLGGALGLDWGMAVAAGAGGWLIGALVTEGAWSRVPHVRRAGPPLLAAVLGLVAWLAGQYAVYLWTRLTLPDSHLGFTERVAATPFPVYFGGIFGPLEVLEIVLIATAAWLAAR